LVGTLHKNKVIKSNKVTDLYDYFTDSTYITDKYNQLFEMNKLKDNTSKDFN